MKTQLKILKKFSTIFKIIGLVCKDHLLALEKYRVYELDDVLKQIDKEHLKFKNVLDFGYGDGFQARYLSQKNFAVSAIDIEKKKLFDDRGIDFYLLAPTYHLEKNTLILFFF